MTGSGERFADDPHGPPTKDHQPPTTDHRPPTISGANVAPPHVCCGAQDLHAAPLSVPSTVELAAVPQRGLTFERTGLDAGDTACSRRTLRPWRWGGAEGTPELELTEELLTALVDQPMAQLVQPASAAGGIVAGMTVRIAYLSTMSHKVTKNSIIFDMNP